MTVGLVGAVALGSSSLVKAIGMVLIGLLLGLVGTDVNSGAMRYTLGFPQLWDGVDFVVVAIGLFAFAEIIQSLEQPEIRESFTGRISRLWPSRKEFGETPQIGGTHV